MEFKFAGEIDNIYNFVKDELLNNYHWNEDEIEKIKVVPKDDKVYVEIRGHWPDDNDVFYYDMLDGHFYLVVNGSTFNKRYSLYPKFAPAYLCN